MEGNEKARMGTSVRGRSVGRSVTPAVLLLLRQAPAHGYDLRARLEAVMPTSDRPPDVGSLYRLLRSLEDEGAVTSWWEPSTAGPGRRVYRITKTGRRQLDNWAAAIDHDIKAMNRFLKIYRSSRPAGRSRAAGVNGTTPTRRRRADTSSQHD